MQKERLRFLLINLISPRLKKSEGEEQLDELKQLVATFGGATIVRVVQRRDWPDNATYIGKGKIQEVANLITADAIDVVVINGIVKPNQIFELEKLFQSPSRTIRVWDRVDLILAIFEKHAHTREAKLQIELAQMRHMGPRIFGLGYVLSRQGGGIGTRGIGETNTELMKRHWQREMKKAQVELEKLEQTRLRQITDRKQRGFQTVAIVGYTNAGKSSLFNAITKKHKLVENALFATLDSATGSLYLPQLGHDVLISDTIGFIKNLPPELIEAFKSTLLQSIHANLLLHVIDIADPKMVEKIAVVGKILHDLGADNVPKIYVFNKIDKVKQADAVWLNELFVRYGQFQPQFTSSKTGDGIAALQDIIGDTFAKRNTDK